MLTQGPRRSLIVAAVLVLVPPTRADEHRTPNFLVTAVSQEVARQVGKTAEAHRKRLARLWLGKEMPPWPEPCPLQVTLTMGGEGGATTFTFDRGSILSQHMRVEGTLERVLAGVVPHEVAHTVFAHYFRRQVPRWADEGAAILSEDEQEHRRHKQLAQQIVNKGSRAIPLSRLFILKEYPSDVLVLYAQGFSVSEFLVSRKSRPAFLNFVADGLKSDWDQAARTHYGYEKVDDLEQAWLAHLRGSERLAVPKLRRTVLPPKLSGR
jgi:hypothetical protein